MPDSGTELTHGARCYMREPYRDVWGSHPESPGNLPDSSLSVTGGSPNRFRSMRTDWLTDWEAAAAFGRATA
jgi:hypothetical protein